MLDCSTNCEGRDYGWCHGGMIGEKEIAISWHFKLFIQHSSMFIQEPENFPSETEYVVKGSWIRISTDSTRNCTHLNFNAGNRGEIQYVSLQISNYKLWKRTLDFGFKVWGSKISMFNSKIWESKVSIVQCCTPNKYSLDVSSLNPNSKNFNKICIRFPIIFHTGKFWYFYSRKYAFQSIFPPGIWSKSKKPIWDISWQKKAKSKVTLMIRCPF